MKAEIRSFSKAEEMMGMLAEKMTEFFNQETPRVSLPAPCTLTVKTGEKYSKKPHIGGELFQASSAYPGKRGMVFVFRPMAAEPYQFMEIEERNIPLILPEFNKTLKRFQDDLVEIRHEESSAKRVVDIAAKEGVYADFGSFYVMEFA